MKLLFALFLGCTPFLSFSQTKVPIDKSQSSITYAMNHIMHAWEGTSNQLNGIVQLNNSGQVEKVAIITKVSAFDSKSSNRDAHMMEVTEALKFPTISFQSTSIEYANKEKLLVKGLLDFHGVKKEISFEGAMSKKGTKTIVSGNFIFLLEDFKIERPSFMLSKVDNEVKVNFEAAW
ncbi:MAG: hypothetical protein RLY11_553 [Bacteroidota bacterium]|jgi:polyisoprenoid-binding protein YceI